MGVSALGTGSGILTQDLLDKLRASDESAQITPIDLNITLQNDKKAEFDILDATMKNLSDAVNELKTPALFDERTTAVSGTSVEITAAANSDLQDFTLNVTQLATKQIEESGSFVAQTTTIATAAGSMNLNVDGVDFTINYDATTTLEDLKNSINTIAGDKVNASIVQIANGDYRLFLNSANTGSTQDITITDTTGNLSDDGGTTAGGTKLTSGFTAVQTGVDANFTYNGQAITRNSNNVTDLVTGYDITLKELGSSTVSVTQNRDNIMSRVDSFVSQYNAAIDELTATTKSSTDSSVRGIFSSDSSIKNMQRSLESMIGSSGEGVTSMYDFGFNVDKYGKMSIDKTLLNQKLDADPKSVEAAFSGGNYTDANGVTTTMTGMFNEMAVYTDEMTGYKGTLDTYSTSISDRLTSLEDKKLTTTERLDAKYAILQKQYAAYDAMIASFNRSADMFTQMTTSTTQTN